MERIYVPFGEKFNILPSEDGHGFYIEISKHLMVSKKSIKKKVLLVKFVGGEKVKMNDIVNLMDGYGPLKDLVQTSSNSFEVHYINHRGAENAKEDLEHREYNGNTIFISYV